jgi:hypothetical protein
MWSAAVDAMIYGEWASGPDDDVPAKQMLSDQR